MLAGDHPSVRQSQLKGSYQRQTALTGSDSNAHLDRFQLQGVQKKKRGQPKTSDHPYRRLACHLADGAGDSRREGPGAVFWER